MHDTYLTKLVKPKLYLGDCLDIISRLPDNSVDAVICDPPYGTTNAEWDKIIPIKEMWEQLHRVTKVDGNIILTSEQPYTSQLVVSDLKNFRFDIIYEKTAATGFYNASLRPLRAHEVILLFNRGKIYYCPQKTTGHERKTSLKRKKNSSEVYNANTSDTYYDSTERYPRSVVQFKKDKQQLAVNSTQKPLALMEWLVNSFTQPGDVVLDFAFGSCTTGVACAKLGRNFIGIEKDRKAYVVGKLRLLQQLKLLLEPASCLQ